MSQHTVPLRTSRFNSITQQFTVHHHLPLINVIFSQAHPHEGWSHGGQMAPRLAPPKHSICGEDDSPIAARPIQPLQVSSLRIATAG
jgi:hypothetical protein